EQQRRWCLRREVNVSALPSLPQSVSRGASISGLPRFTHLLRPARLLGALYGSDRLPGQRRLLRPGFQRDRSVAGYDYSGGWTPPLVGLSPTGTTTRLAARPRNDAVAHGCSRVRSISAALQLMPARRRSAASPSNATCPQTGRLPRGWSQDLARVSADPSIPDAIGAPAPGRQAVVHGQRPT